MKIILNENKQTQASLQNKLEEYYQRYGYMAPEVNPHAFFKLQLMNTLVTTGELDIERERTKLMAWTGFSAIEASTFDNAVGVIMCYNSGDLDMLRGGTGLR